MHTKNPQLPRSSRHAAARGIGRILSFFLLLVGGCFAAAFLGLYSLEPSNDRTWQTDVQRLASVEFNGSEVTIHNVRNFDYHSETEMVPRWETRTYDLEEVVAVDFILSYWDDSGIAHTIVSWAFSDGRQLPISIETRKEVGESYSSFWGFFRQYELYYVVSDERDVLRLRSNYRNEQVYLYRLQYPVAVARALLEDYLHEVNSLAHSPQWYNALAHNCTTTIRKHAKHVDAANTWDWRILVNGRIDEMGYERGLLDTSLPFDELRSISNISKRAQQADAADDFSTRIRIDLPGMELPATLLDSVGS